MKAVIIFLAFICITVSVVVNPFEEKKDDGNKPNCNDRSVSIIKLLKTRPIHKAASFLCEMCLDLVEIAEMYAECDEAYVDKVLDKKCDSYFHSGYMDKACRDMCDEIMKELEADTDKNPSKVCTKITKSDCHY